MAYQDWVEYECLVCNVKLSGPNCPDHGSTNVREKIPVQPNTRQLFHEKRLYTLAELDELDKKYAQYGSRSELIRKWLRRNVEPGKAIPVRHVAQEFWQKGTIGLFNTYKHANVRIRTVADQLGWSMKTVAGATMIIRPKEHTEGWNGPPEAGPTEIEEGFDI